MVIILNSIEKLASDVLNENEAIVVSSKVNRRYLTSFASSAGYLYITKEEAYLLVDFRYIEAAQKAKNVKVEMFTDFSISLVELSKKHNIKKVYFENDELSFSVYNKYQKLLEQESVEVDTENTLSEALKKIRQIKSEFELSKMREAQRLTDATYDYILPRIKEGLTEKEIALDMEFFMRKNGAFSVSFDLIIVAGANSSLCHGVPGENKVKKGDFITMDTGCVVDGYCSDMTRTVALGSVSEEQKDVYDTVLKAQLAATEAILPGAVCCDIDKIARDIIDAKYPDCFGHGLGHSLGLLVHETPNFNRLDKTVLQPGMILTNEPGIYLQGKFGVRIEDMVLVTENSRDIFTKSTKELVIL